MATTKTITWRQQPLHDQAWDQLTTVNTTWHRQATCAKCTWPEHALRALLDVLSLFDHHVVTPTLAQDLILESIFTVMSIPSMMSVSLWVARTSILLLPPAHSSVFCPCKSPLHALRPLLETTLTPWLTILVRLRPPGELRHLRRHRSRSHWTKRNWLPFYYLNISQNWKALSTVYLDAMHWTFFFFLPQSHWALF